jgi:hypothetical protein
MNMLLRKLVLVSVVAWYGLIIQANATAAPAALADLKTGGANGGPITILYLGQGVGKTSGYGEELARQGIAFTSCSYFEPLTADFIKKFNVFVLDRLPPLGEEYEVFGQRMVTYRANMKLVLLAVEQGAGALIYPDLADGGGVKCGGWNQEMKPWGIQILPMCIRDPARSFESWRIDSGAENYYCWTENFAKHQVTEGLKRIYYTSANLRWDDCYTAPPLICDKNWTPLVMAMPGATLAQEVDGKWTDQPLLKEGVVLAAVRDVGKGRMGVLSIHPYYIHQVGYSKLPGGRLGEMSPGLVDGIVLKKGDGKIPSDTDALVSRMYAWLGANSAAAGFGGYKSGDPIVKGPALFNEEGKRFIPVLDFDRYAMPPSWRHKAALVQIGENQYYPELNDPSITGELKFFKALVGAHSELSDGKGSVAEYAAEAKKAGYSLIVFTENFEKLSSENWNKLMSQCEQNSTDEFVCLPGFDIQDPDGNHSIVIAPSSYPRASWLTPDGKRIKGPHMLTLSFYNHMVVAHRPGGGPLPYERLKHFQGLTVFTYRDGKLADDSLKAYSWQVQNGSVPLPIVVHELFNPAEVASAAKSGFQQIMPSDTVHHAVDYFRIGLSHFFDAPARYMVSEGPIVYNWVSSPKDIGPDAENRRRFRVAIGVKSDVPLASVTLYDGVTAVRHWLPTGLDFQTTADFQHSYQHDLYVVAQDSKGRRSVTSSIRTVAERYHYRCTDRQNWLGDMFLFVCYTGSRLPDSLDIMMPIKGTAEGSAFFTDVPGTCMAPKINFPFTCNDVSLMEVNLDEKYTTALFDKPGWPSVGLDAMPSMPSQPSDVYTAKRRNYSFTPGKSGKHWLILSEFDITLKRDVEPVNPAGLFPAFGSLRGSKFFRFESGKPVIGLLAKDTVQDVPKGALSGGYIALNDGFQIQNGKFGLAPRNGNPTTIPAGTRFIARFLFAFQGSGPYAGAWTNYAFDDNPETWLNAMGFAGSLPYQLTMTRGKLDSIAYLAAMTPDRGGVAGDVAQTAEIPYDVPLQIHGLNEHWVAGSWREGGEVAYAGVFEGAAWPRLDVSKKGKFYAGNLLTCGNNDLVLEIVKWSNDAVKIEVHNPTDKPITATVSTPAEITNYKLLNQTVTVPAGCTIYSFSFK